MNKRLNNKGFTLVELLAVVVILALVMGIAASSMLGTMNSSRQQTLYSAAQTAATNVNNWVLEDMLATTAGNQMLGNDFISFTQSEMKNQWVCLEYYKTEDRNGDGRNEEYGVRKITNKGTETNLINVLNLNKADLIINGKGTPPTKDATTKKYVIDATTCSAIRYNAATGGYEFFLNAKSGGKYFVASETDNYAFNRAATFNTQLTD